MIYDITLLYKGLLEKIYVGDITYMDRGGGGKVSSFVGVQN